MAYQSRERAMSGTETHLEPIAHIHPVGGGWINDPNGPIVLDGLYHVYFQYNPVEARHQGIRWGHAVSVDLVRWELRPVAITPTTELDRDGVYSGMTLRDGDDVVAFYSGYREDRRYQPVLRAVSTDGGESFGTAVQVVAEPPPELGVDEYRDPFVWREGETWRMLVGSALPDNVGAALLYESADQLVWEARGAFASAHAREMHEAWGVDTGNMWEVPQYVEPDGVPTLLVSAFRRGTGPMRVFVLTGARETDRFTPRACRYLDDGPDWFAASVLTEADGRVLVWGWGRESLRTPTPMAGWAGLLSFPRELRLRADGQVGSFPPAELIRLRGGEPRQLVAGAGPVEVPRAFEMRLDAPAPEGSVHIRLAFADGLGVTVRFDSSSRTVVVDPEGPYDAARIDAGDDGPLELRWFFDHSVSELFVSTGGVATHRIYPPCDGAFTIELSGDGSVTADVWELRP
jgi:beta-fructofuranosidase